MRAIFCNPTYDDFASGRAVWVDGVAYRRTHTVSYSQQGVSHSKSYASEEAARAAFEAALREDRECWSRCPNGYIETNETTERAIVVRFRSRLKNGKPGKLTGIRMLHATKEARQ